MGFLVGYEGVGSWVMRERFWGEDLDLGNKDKSLDLGFREL